MYPCYRRLLSTSWPPVSPFYSIRSSYGRWGTWKKQNERSHLNLKVNIFLVVDVNASSVNISPRGEAFLIPSGRSPLRFVFSDTFLHIIKNGVYQSSGCNPSQICFLCIQIFSGALLLNPWNMLFSRQVECKSWTLFRKASLPEGVTFGIVFPISKVPPSKWVNASSLLRSHEDSFVF